MDKVIIYWFSREGGFFLLLIFTVSETPKALYMDKKNPPHRSGRAIEGRALVELSVSRRPFREFGVEARRTKNLGACRSRVHRYCDRAAIGGLPLSKQKTNKMKK